VMENWQRDDRMELVRNPTYHDAPRPYLDSLTVRVIPDDEQRIDTYTTASLDGFYSNIPSSIERGVEDGGGTAYSIPLADAIILMPNNESAPFDDVRMRRVLTLAIDREAMVDVASPGSDAAENFTLEGSDWYTPEAAVPSLDLTEAQRLVDEIVAETGSPIRVSMISSQSNPSQAEFVQTSLSQLEDVEVSVEVLDAPTFIGKVRAGEYQLVAWGLPWLDPDVSIGTFFGSGLSTNYSKYSNAEVDALIKSSSVTDDLDERVELYGQVFEMVAEDAGVVPLWHGAFGWVFSDSVHDVELYEDGIPRWDLIWRDA
jgi:peptide/nickel transport system substrate-binding protein